MVESELRVSSSSLRQELLQRLRGRVFHVTCASNVPAIVQAGSINANPESRFRSGFPSASHSLFRERGCVCVFDYRSLSDHELKVALDACAPDMPARDCEGKLAILFLAPESYGNLQLATMADWSRGMVVPFAEAGYPSAIPLAAIEEKLDVVVALMPGPFD